MTTPPFALTDLRAILQNAPGVLAALLSPLSVGLLEADEGPGTWSPSAVLRHMVWAEVDDWMPRVRLIRNHGATQSFRPFDREEGFRRYADWPLNRLLSEFAQLRAQNLAELDQLALSDADLLREGLHPELGPVTMQQLLGTWVTHDFAHLAQIARVLTKATGHHIGPWRAYFSLLGEPRE